MPKITLTRTLLALNAVLLAGLIWTTARSQAPASAQPVQAVVRARLIELVNERSEMRAQLHVADSGGGELRMRNRGGDIRVKFGATDDGARWLKPG